MPFKDDTASIISDAVGIAAAEGGLDAACKVVAVIEAVAYGVSVAPSAEAQARPGLSIEAICEQARNAVPASSEMRRTGAFEFVLESIRDALSQIETWEANSNLSPAIVYTGAPVANSVAMLLESGCRLNAADIWSDAAERAHDRLRSTIINTSYSTPPLPDRATSSRAGGGELRNTDPGPGTPKRCCKRPGCGRLLVRSENTPRMRTSWWH
ncbi:predicted protein [Chaetomium globosum CBS 148.51]|uniref:Uncharacterized protein n=1 Tax=Chaetomium globosum (strain ATCC 6205 / CBS 148.51 / DSM 1962 / NBRC 6347 / NRRL 1970) TaxID=306901 RepID=Q2HDD7_CHAGB|nr:uncharacterized protein CHGG_01767 [Chaetomium globosum CBS 148.51]EAQ93532.1 predicted protein [Chaetomium globosum CBS 148.51]